ncbi:MAG TPA: NUDIX domain-containing protein [Bacteroidales bacterium]|nr:NUDIX domain-containing protein [Bacteroidales bacterium]HRZ49557.1 NUDIX domain-containing protein [Bacteroidales bacterium]
MYKIFVNQTLLQFRDPSEGHLPSAAVLNSADPGEVKRRLSEFIIPGSNKLLNNLLIYTADPRKAFSELLQSCRFVPAAGGLVSNRNREILVIFRRGLWDLPKGKKEEKETYPDCAVRETYEETGVLCGITNSQPVITHHLYIENNQWCHKETQWYKMSVKDETWLMPQPAEDILCVRWADSYFINRQVLPSTYPLIREVIGSWLRDKP